jgi:hypothetical protein
MTESLISSICKLADAMVMSDSSKAIIQKFPYLCEKIGSGYDGWYIYIKDKLKNVRRKSDEPSVSKDLSNIFHIHNQVHFLMYYFLQFKCQVFVKNAGYRRTSVDILGEKSDGMIKVYDVSFKTI